MKKIITLLLITLVLLTSCRPFEDLSREYTPASTWGEFFDLYWKRMSTNYLFWELDYNEGRDWDRVYDEYMPKFSALGNIKDNIEGREMAYSYLYDIISKLSDGHYVIRLNTTGTYTLGNNDSIRISPSAIRSLSKLGYTKEEILEYGKTVYDEAKKNPKYDRYFHSGYDNVENMGSILSSKGFNNVNEYKKGDLNAVLSKNSDGIVYFGFDGFEFYQNFSDPLMEKFVSDYLSQVCSNDTKGIIIDLRGNGGGSLVDLNILWTPFLQDDFPTVKVGEKKTKSSEGRTSYGPWVDFNITRIENLRTLAGTVNKSVPIAILQNGGSASCSEFSILLFHCLRENYGYNVRTFGVNSIGANGALYELDNNQPVSEDHYNGGITYDLNPYGIIIYTPYCLTRSYNGVIYEGVGIPADENIELDYNAFRAGTDNRFNAAISWIESVNNN